MAGTNSFVENVNIVAEKIRSAETGFNADLKAAQDAAIATAADLVIVEQAKLDTQLAESVAQSSAQLAVNAANTAGLNQVAAKASEDAAKISEGLAQQHMIDASASAQTAVHVSDLAQGCLIEVQNLQTLSQSIKTAVEGMQTNISGMQTDVTGKRDSVVTMESHVAAMEASVVSLKNQISVMIESAPSAVIAFAAHVEAVNPHGITPAMIGLGNVNNTADLDKPISTAGLAEINRINNLISTVQSGLQSAIDVVASGVNTNADLINHMASLEPAFQQMYMDVSALSNAFNAKILESDSEAAAQANLSLKLMSGQISNLGLVLKS